MTEDSSGANASTRTLSASLMRLAPGTLRSRLALTVLLVTLAVLIAAIGSFILTERLSRPTIAREVATDELRRAQSDLERLVTRTETHVEAPRQSLQHTLAEKSVGIPAEFSERLSLLERSAGAACVVVARGPDEISYSAGTPSDVARMLSVLPSRGSEPVRGYLELESGPCAVVAQPIAGGVSPAWLAIAVPLSENELSVKGASRVLKNDGADDSPETFSLNDPYFHEVSLSLTDGGFVMWADIPSIDGVSAGTLVSEVDGTWAIADSVLGLTALLATGCAALTGVVVGLLGSRAIASEVRQVTDHVREAGAAALSGRPVPRLERSPYMAEELANLLDTFDRMLENSRRRQSEIEAARAALEEAKRSAEAVVNESPEGKVLVVGGSIVLANPAAANILGMTVQDLIGLEGPGLLTRLKVTDDTGSDLEATEIVTKASEGSLKVCIERPDGLARWVELRSTLHESSESVSFLLSGRDITEEKRVEELRGEIVSLVSHDLRAPLTVITGYLDLLGGRKLKADARDKAIVKAREASERMLVLLQDLLDVARADEILSPAVLVPVEMDEVVSDIVNSFAHTSAHRFVMHLQEGSTVRGDEKRLRQVVANLVTNAMKYSPDGTDIDVRVHREDKRVLFSIEDEGPGIPEAQRRRIFERYTRVQESEEGKRSGIGLGLYIVKAIVEGHGGVVRVVDPEGSMGSRFVVELPAAEDGEPAE